MINLERCKSEIIERGFPELRDVAISVSYRKVRGSFFSITKNSRYNYDVKVSNNMKTVKREVVIGGVSHEMAHISRELSRWEILNSVDQYLYDHFKWYERRDERATDLLVVRRGFGYELLELAKYLSEIRKPQIIDQGLKVEELERILKRKI